MIIRYLLIFLLLFVGNAWGTTYYVKTGGNDSSVGTTDATAWETITKVNSSAAGESNDVYFKCGDTFNDAELDIDWSGTAGDGVIVGAYYVDGSEVVGVSGDKPKIEGNRVEYYPFYDQHHTTNNSAVLIETKNSWVIDELIGLEVYNVTDGSQCTITDNNATTVTCNLAGGAENDWDIDEYYRIGSPVPDRHYGSMIRANNQSYVTVQDIAINDSSWFGSRLYNCDSCNLLRCDTSNTGVSGLSQQLANNSIARGSAGGNKLSQIANCTVATSNLLYALRGNQGYDIGTLNSRHVWIHNNAVSNSYGEAIGVYNTSATSDQGDTIVEDNIITNVRKTGVYLANVGYNIVRRNRITHNGDSAYYLLLAGGRYWAGPGIYVGSEKSGIYLANQIENNLIYNNVVSGATSGVQIDSGWNDGEDAFVNNLIYNNTTNNNQYEVKISAGAEDAFEDPGTSTNEIKNNIFASGSDSTDELFDSYIPTTGIVWDYNLWTAAVIAGATGVNDPTPAAPLFTDAANGDFTLQGTSPCINAGLDLGSDYEDALDPDSTWPDGVTTLDQDAAGGVSIGN